jgi:hypothetical protein
VDWRRHTEAVPKAQSGRSAARSPTAVRLALRHEAHRHEDAEPLRSLLASEGYSVGRVPVKTTATVPGWQRFSVRIPARFSGRAQAGDREAAASRPGTTKMILNQPSTWPINSRLDARRHQAPLQNLKVAAVGQNCGVARGDVARRARTDERRRAPRLRRVPPRARAPARGGLVSRTSGAARLMQKSTRTATGRACCRRRDYRTAPDPSPPRPFTKMCSPAARNGWDGQSVSSPICPFGVGCRTHRLP